MRKRFWRHSGVVLAAVAAGVVSGVFVAGPASAHVSVDPKEATQGGYTKLTFRVPNEKDAADTVKVEINLPADKPIASISTKPLDGWTVQADRTKLDKPIKSDDGEITEAVTKITWTAAAGAAIKPGQFQEFDVSAGPLPETDKIVFKALQTYSDGDIVRWIEEPGSGGAEPEHPAPTLTLAKKSDDSGGQKDTATAAKGEGSADNDAGDGSTAAIVLGVAGLVAGLGGLALGLLAYRKATARA
jgi:uncharacterized protein YcnI